VQFMYQYPETTGVDGDMLDAGPVAEVAAAAERAGWHGFSLTEHPIPGARWLGAGGHQTLDPFVGLGHVAAVTSRLRLLTYLAVLPYRNPFLLAKAAATVDKLSDGRFILGVGTGYQKAEFHALGVDFEERNALFDEALDVFPQHWRGEPFSYKGLHFDARDVIARPRPVSDPIPIWIGGNAKITLRRVAERAQGWLPLVGSAELSVTARTPQLGSLEEIGATIQDLQDQAAARGQRLDIAMSYTDTSIASPEVDVDRHRDTFGSLAEVGVTWIIVPVASTTPPETFDFIAAFGDTYIES
jgi:probable F420-dependent oxidoreductase